MTVFVDTGFWFGLNVKRDKRHAPATALWRSSTEQLITTDQVLGETWTLARVRGVHHPQAMALIDAVNASSRVEVVQVDEHIARESWDWLRGHDERVYSFVDATSFTVMRRRRLRRAFTFDGDFAAAGFTEVRPD
jgi:predicted nucleic acid-binding protein